MNERLTVCRFGFLQNGDLQSKVKAAKQCGRLFREETIWQWYDHLRLSFRPVVPSRPYTRPMRRFIQLCTAMKHVHDRKILHRDIKSANIFLSGGKEGEDPMVKLGDFGISKILEFTADCANTAVGTPYYMRSVKPSVLPPAVLPFCRSSIIRPMSQYRPISSLFTAFSAEYWAERTRALISVSKIP